MNKLHIAVALATLTLTSAASAQKLAATKQILNPTTPTSSTQTSFLVGGGDNCATPDAIAGAGPFAFDNTIASTGAEGQSNGLCLAFGTTGIESDVWFTWTAPSTGLFQVSLCAGASTDSKVAVYNGVGCPAAAAIACNDDSCLIQSVTNFNGVSGNTYTIQVGTYPGTLGGSGTFTVTYEGVVGPTANADNCATPVALTGTGFFGFDTTTATTGTQGQTESLCLFFGTTIIANDVWATWVGTGNGIATIELCGGSTFDTKVAVYQASTCPTLGSALACNDDTCHGQSEVMFNVTCGTTYLLQIGRYVGTGGGAGLLSISVSGGACNPGVSFCFGDGTGTPCPCANSGAVGNGCAHSLNANGANLTASGTASLAADTLVLSGSGMPDSSALYFQGTTRVNSGSGAAFGDGLRCAGGTVVRLATKTNVSGASQYPSGADQSVSVRGSVTVPGTRTYQVWYRNAAAFCTTSTFNLANGYDVTWLP